MIRDPQFTGPFSDSDSAAMRNVYVLAESGLSATQCLDEKTRFTLASIVLYIFMCEKRSNTAKNIDQESLANEALDVLLQMPR